MKQHVRFTLIALIVLLSAAVFALTQANACTGIITKTQDNNYIMGRSMEFASDFISHHLIFVPRNFKYTGQTPSGKPGMPWMTIYAHVGFSPSTLPIVDDGINEKGLYCGGFFHPGYAKYETVVEKDFPKTISSDDIGSWILSTCATASEVRERLPKIHVCGVVNPQLGYVAPMHCLVIDKTGDAVIIEYLEGKLVMYDNKANVITNSPVYTWHIENLRNYIALKPDNAATIKINGNDFVQFGQGSGAIGLPGDFTPPSRFVRAAFLARSVFQGKNVDEGIGMAFHIMNQFDIPLGAVRGMQGNKPANDTTQWTSVSDLTNARYFYHTYNDRSVRVIDFKKLDLNASTVKSIEDIQQPGKITDVSGQLK